MMNTYANIRFTYLVTTTVSMLLMLGGWLWHLFTHEETNPMIIAGMGLLMLTPVLALLHVCVLSWERDKRLFWSAAAVILLVGLAYWVGWRASV